jgi:hypothetical protein
MAATGRDIAVFVVGVLAAGAVPVVALPSVQLRPMLAVVAEVANTFPLEHIALVVFLALVVSAWVDTAEAPPAAVDAEQWD